MKRVVLAITLACALSVTVLAGEVSTTGAPALGATQGPSIAATIVLTVLSLIR